MSGSKSFKYKGYKIEFNDDGDYVYSDSKKLISNDVWRACGHCGLEPTKEDHDGCLGELPGLMNACCGHGLTSSAYIQYPSGQCVRGRLAKKLIKKLKGGE